MGFIDALETFSDRLPSALEELRELKDDLNTLVGDAIKEGTELFTLGYDEMVIKDNNDWQTSYSNNDEAEKLVNAIEENYPELQQELIAQREHTRTALKELEEIRNRCVEYLVEMKNAELNQTETINICSQQPASYIVAIDNIVKIKRTKFFASVEEADESISDLTTASSPCVQDAIRRNNTSKKMLNMVRARVNDSCFVQAALSEELSTLQQLSTAARCTIALFESIEKVLATCVAYMEAAHELQSEEEHFLSDELTLGITQIYAYASQAEKIVAARFLNDSDAHVNPAFNDLLNADAEPFIQASSKICRDIKELMQNAVYNAVIINTKKRPALFCGLPVKSIRDTAGRTEHDDE